MPAFRKLTFFLLTSGLIAVLLSSYPIVFFGKSYVSPGYGPQLLYDDWPSIAGIYSSLLRPGVFPTNLYDGFEILDWCL